MTASTSVVGSGSADQLPLPTTPHTTPGPEGEAGPGVHHSLALESGDAAPVTSPGVRAGAAPLVFTVEGVPIPQGSHKGYVVNGRAVITQDNKKTRPWRSDVKHAALEARGAQPPIEGPVEVLLRFVMPRPKHHFRTGRNAHLLRDNAPGYPATKPDGDKLVRAIFDALTAAGVWRDDSQVVHHDAWKVYADHRFGEIPCAHVHVQVAS